MKKKLFTLLTLLVAVCSGAWADANTTLISGVTLPSLPTGTYTGGTEVIHKGSNKAVVLDGDANGVMQASAPGYGSPTAANFTWCNAYNETTDGSWSTSGASWNAPSGSLFVGSANYNNSSSSHNVTFARKCNLRTNRTFAYRFTNCGGVSVLVKSQGKNESAAAVLAVYMVNSDNTLTSAGSALSIKNAQEVITVDGLIPANTYVAYVYGANTSNGELDEIAFLAPSNVTEYTIEVTVDDAEHGSAESSLSKVKEGNSVTLTATANTGWAFKNWTDSNDNVISTANPYTISNVSANVSLTANFEAVTTHTLTINAGETGALGNYYDNTVITQNEGTTVKLPIKNSYFYKEGYTATGWTDGTNDYAFGADLTLDKNYTVYPKFTQNTKVLAENAATVTWNLSKAVADKLHIENTTGYVVTTAVVGGETIDVPSYWDNTSGKIDNRSRDDASSQVNGGSKFTIPAQKGMTITLAASYQIAATAAGDDMTATTESPFTATYTYTGTENEIEIVINGGSYFSSIVATYPGPVAAPSNLTITGAPTEAITLADAVTLTAAAEGNPAPTYEWFQCDNAEKDNPVSKGTSATLTPTLSIGTNYFYFVATNEVGSTTSDVKAITVNARTNCALTKVVYSNSFDAFINEPANENHGTIQAYYMAGSEAPTINSAIVSDGATYAVSGNTLTVTAEDGTTTADYDITLEAVNPFAGESLTFNGSETFVKTGYTYTSERGWRFAKNADDGRIAKGWTRLYFFVGKGESVTLTNGGIDTERNVEVYVNGVKNTSIAKVPKSSASTNSITITTNTDACNMIAVVSNQTGGDGGFTAISVTNPDVTSLKETISTGTGKTYATYVTTNKLDVSTVSGAIALYKAVSATTTSVKLESLTQVPAGTPVLVKTSTAGASVDVPVTSADVATFNDNMLKAGPATLAGDGTEYILSNGMFYQAEAGNLASGKAYLKTGANLGRSLVFSFEEEATGIKTINNDTKNLLDGEFYNLAGQRVALPTKGMYIVNGKKVAVK